LDVYTIRAELGTVNGLIVGIVGDLKNGRTVHSLVQLLSLYNITHIHYVSPSSLRIPKEIMALVDEKKIPQTEHTSLDDIISKVDVLYVTRIQKERFCDIGEYERVKDSFIITPKTLTKAKEKMIVMHPLPRLNEISSEVDSDPRAAYFRQMENGMFVRMALLALILGKV
jgi:aspartate carbamoyltransferase